MRLLKYGSAGCVNFTKDLTDTELSNYKYAILSHTWGRDEDEVTYDDVVHGIGTTKPGSGSEKIRFCAQQTQRDGLQYFWVDTCCIDKTNSAELSKSLISMFRWYSNAERCYVFLADVPPAEQAGDLEVDWERCFRTSRWFQRGWTLQELLAPRSLQFFSRNGRSLGTKASLEQAISSITRIPAEALRGQPLATFSVNERLSWQEHRRTKEEEDMVYSLLGIFDVSMPVLYGEGKAKAQARLRKELSSDHGGTIVSSLRDRHEAIITQCNKHSQDLLASSVCPHDAAISIPFDVIASWLSPSDPQTNHRSALRQRVAETGTWLLQRAQYEMWKSGKIGHLWLHGKAGCGKTLLCATAIQDLQKYCQNRPNFGLAMFYFTFSDTQKQSYDDLLKALVCQLGRHEPALSTLRHLYERPHRQMPASEVLEDILHLSMSRLDVIMVVLDALDEIPETDGVRREALTRLTDLVQRTPKPKLLVASRHVLDVRSFAEDLAFREIVITPSIIDADIHTYVSSQLSTDRRLRHFSSELKTLIEQKISQNADGMFRWANLLLEQLKGIKSSKPSLVRETLNRFPTRLDDVYARVLMEIEPSERKDALTLLRWLAYSRVPVTLGELRDAVVIDPDSNSVQLGDRGDIQDTLRLLSGLVTPIGNKKPWEYSQYEHWSYKGDSMADEEIDLLPFNLMTEVRLAHFTVKEYLESTRILQGNTKIFRLENTSGHYHLSRSCLAYIVHYSQSNDKTLEDHDLVAFPLLQYAASSWYYHSALHHRADVSFETRCLMSRTFIDHWTSIHQPASTSWIQLYPRHRSANNEGLFYASHLGLDLVVKQMLDDSANVSFKDDMFSDALYAGASEGCLEAESTIFEEDAPPAVPELDLSTALMAASTKGHIEIIQLLLNRGANSNTHSLMIDKALQRASRNGHPAAVKLLLDYDAHVDSAVRGAYGNALRTASSKSRSATVKVLFDFRAGANARVGRVCGHALHAASLIRQPSIVRLLLANGADAHAKRDYMANVYAALCASVAGSNDTIDMPAHHNASIDAESSNIGSRTALCAALLRCNSTTTMTLRSRGADINAKGDRLRGPHALYAASRRGDVEITALLLNYGAYTNADEGQYGGSTALCEASGNGNVEMVTLLLGRGAEISAEGDARANALDVASYSSRTVYATLPRGWFKTMMLLLDHYVKDKAGESSDGEQALVKGMLASSYMKLVKLLLVNSAHALHEQG